MEKVYTLLNSTFKIEGPEDLFTFLDNDLVLFPLYTKKPREYKISYELNPKLYEDVLNDLKKQKKEIVRIFGDEYKEKIDNKDIIFLIDDDSVIVNTNTKFMIIGKTEFSKFHVLYFIREAIYEGYLLDNDLMLHSAAFSTDHEHGNVLVGAPGAGKTTFLMENLIGLPSAYISNDLVGVHNNRAMASIIPVRVAHGTLSNFNHQEYENLEEKETYPLPDFLKEYSLETDSNVGIRNIVFPHFNLHGSFDISKVDKKEAKKIITSQTMNYGDPVRPYLWVNEFNINDCNQKNIESKLNNLIGSSETYNVTYGPNMTQDDLKIIRKVLKI